jgi:hypothetical protein
MTQLLQRALAEIEKLPSQEQDALASRILDDLADERAWAARFEATSSKQWDRLAALAQQDITAGETISLEDMFPSKATED